MLHESMTKACFGWSSENMVSQGVLRTENSYSLDAQITISLSLSRFLAYGLGQRNYGSQVTNLKVGCGYAAAA